MRDLQLVSVSLGVDGEAPHGGLVIELAGLQPGLQWLPHTEPGASRYCWAHPLGPGRACVHYGQRFVDRSGLSFMAYAAPGCAVVWFHVLERGCLGSLVTLDVLEYLRRQALLPEPVTDGRSGG